jgi:small-conductance mechanosensitive channel
VNDFSDIFSKLTGTHIVPELLTLTACLVGAWMACSLLRRVFHSAGWSVLFGARLIDGLLFPALALVLVMVAKVVLVAVVSSAVVFKIAIPVLLSLVLIRLSVRVLSAAFPHATWIKATERTISWAAWVAVILWTTGVLPLVLQELDGVNLKIGAAKMSLRTLLEGALTASVVMVLALWAAAALEKKIIGGSGGDLSTRKMISNIMRAVLLLVGLLFALVAAGIDLTALSVIGGALGVGLGLGLQKVAANYISGFVILAERSLRIGDTVKVDNFEGRITDIRTRYTVIRAPNGREAIVPNEMLVTHRVENASLLTADTTVQISVPVFVAHGTAVRALQPRVEEALSKVARILHDPAPFVQLSNFVPNGMELTIRYWLSDPNKEQDLVKSNANLAILDAMSAQGVEFPEPHRIVVQGGPYFYPEDGHG